MSLRAYLLIDVVDDVDQQQFVKVLKELEDMQGIEFVDPVAGGYDIVVIVDTSLSIENMVTKIQSKPWLRKVEVLRIVSIFERRGTLSSSQL